MENQEIKAWIEGSRDYNEGRSLFEKYSKRKGLINLFRRKKKPDVLLYNLQKLLNTTLVLTRVLPLPGKVILPETGEITEKRLQVDSGSVKYDQLPESLKTLYDQNRVLYKQMRALHEKMKIATTDDIRAKLREELAAYDDVIAENWQKIDAWDGTIKSEDEEETPFGDEEKKKQVIAARKFLSVNLEVLNNSEGLKRQQLAFKIADRIRFLQQNQIIIGEKVLENFRKLGVDC